MGRSLEQTAALAWQDRRGIVLYIAPLLTWYASVVFGLIAVAVLVFTYGPSTYKIGFGESSEACFDARTLYLSRSTGEELTCGLTRLNAFYGPDLAMVTDLSTRLAKDGPGLDDAEIAEIEATVESIRRAHGEKDPAMPEVVRTIGWIFLGSGAAVCLGRADVNRRHPGT
ncbi:hypothetical protein ACFCV3_29765 [Kribbella sp. NPDC056345]|uniref:hypothetical protein n=1 Tax=Kribbella sp. NPDC056345 TaxID=3345789 RepID=UPI0035D5A471